MTDVVDAESGSTWYSWNKAQLERPRNEQGNLSNAFATTVRGVLAAVPTAVLALAAVTTLSDTRYNRWVIFGTLSGGFWVAVVAIWCLRYVLIRNYWHRLWRAMRTFVALGLVAFIVSAAMAGGRRRVWYRGVVGGWVGGREGFVSRPTQ